MTLLIKEQIVEALARGSLVERLQIVPLLDPDRQIGPGSVDLRLGTEFLEADRRNQTVIAPATQEDPSSAWSVRSYVPLGGPFVLHPGQFVLGSTLEFLSMPSDLAGQVLSRSSWGRLGLLVATAVVVQPGFRGVLTLELVNTGSVPIELRTGLRIAQLQLWAASGRTADPYSSRGQYSSPLGPEAPKFRSEQDELERLRRIASKMSGTGAPEDSEPAQS